MALGLLLTSLPACLADIRPESLQTAAYTAEQRADGRAILLESMRAHGLRAFEKLDTLSLTVSDTWHGIGEWATPYAANPQRYRHDLVAGTFSSRLTLLEGPDAGQVWGIQNWRSFRAVDQLQSPSGAANTPAKFEHDDNIYFLLPTLQYFAEFAFRIDAAALVAAAGRIEHAGRSYDLVFATWGDGQPGTDADQYLIWIDSETKLMAKLRYTVRESARFLTGTMHYQDYRPVSVPGAGRLMFPYRQTIALSAPEEIANEEALREDAFHEMIVESVEANQLPRAAVLGDADAPAGGDYKP